VGQTGGGLDDGREGIGLRKKGWGKGRYNVFFITTLTWEGRNRVREEAKEKKGM
jgi:hypothetical protein